MSGQRRTAAGNRVLDALLLLLAAAVGSYALLLGHFGAGRVPTHFDIGLALTLLLLTPSGLVLGLLTRSARNGRRRWPAAGLVLLLGAAGLVLLVIGVGKLT